MNTPTRVGSRIRGTRDQLAAQLLSHPAVSMIDIGRAEPRLGANPVLRVHLRPNAGGDLQIPQEINGFIVQVIKADYRKQS